MKIKYILEIMKKGQINEISHDFGIFPWFLMNDKFGRKLKLNVIYMISLVGNSRKVNLKILSPKL